MVASLPQAGNPQVEQEATDRQESSMITGEVSYIESIQSSR